MTGKYALITELYHNTLEEITSSQGNWQAFLRSACNNYKCRFDEQVLIYAQRPAATAVLEIDRWNKQFGRWVNYGAKGIAVFDDSYNGRARLKYYFDISDTHAGRDSHFVPLWTMKKRYENEIITALQDGFGNLDTDDLTESLVSTAHNVTDDNISHYLSELLDCRDGSLLENKNEDKVQEMYQNALQNSVAYMIMTRCGLDADRHFSADDFIYINSFNTLQTLNAIGIATSDLSEMVLRRIALTVRNIEKEEKSANYTFCTYVNKIDTKMENN